MIEHIVASKKRMVQSNGERGVPAAERFSQEVLLPRLVAALEAAGGPDEPRANG